MCPKVENFLKNALKQFWPLLCLSRTGPWTVDTVHFHPNHNRDDGDDSYNEDDGDDDVFDCENAGL